MVEPHIHPDAKSVSVLLLAWSAALFLSAKAFVEAFADPDLALVFWLTVSVRETSVRAPFPRR